MREQKTKIAELERTMDGNDPATQSTRSGGIIAAENSTNLANAIRGLKEFNGKNPTESKT